MTRAEHQQQFVWTNDFKIRFCNGAHAIIVHAGECKQCAEYIHSGDGDLCKDGKLGIMKAMVLEDDPNHPIE